MHKKKPLIPKMLLLLLVMTFSLSVRAQYCTTGLYYYGCVYNDYIRSVSTTGGATNISNLNTTCNGGYAGYTFFNTQVLTAAQGATIGFTLLNNPNYGEYYKIWIDFNGNGNFTDAGEQVFAISLSANGSVTSSFTIPGTATVGTTRMRVRCVYPSSSSGITPCGFYYGGEIEDYTVVITGSSVACTGTPAPGNTLSTANPVCPSNAFTLSFQTSITGSGVTYQWQSSPNGSTWTNITGATATTLTTTQSTSTYYRCAATCGSNTGFSNSLLVNTNSFLNCYCAASNSSGCGFSDVINNVTFGTLNNSTGCTATPAYTNYGGLVAAPNISIGATTPISVTVGAGGTERVAAWIDYNQNGIFETTEFTSIGTGNGSVVTNNINVPSTATAGLTKMRVRVRWSTTILSTDPCTTFSFGETEDYNVNLVCTSPTFTANPSSATLCSGNNVSFTATATGSAISYQWQENRGLGFVNITNGGVYTGATTGTLTLVTPPPSFNGYQYRCIAAATCGTATATSNVATLTLGAATTIINNPPNTTVCLGAPVSFTVNAIASNITYQWQINDGTGYYTLPNGGIYSNVNTPTLNISAAGAGINGYGYRCVITGTCAPLQIISQTALLTVGAAIPVTTQPANTTICSGGNTSMSVITGGANVVYQWQVNTGSGFSNISNGGSYSGVTTNVLNISNTPLTFNTYQYRCVLSNTCVAPFFTNSATLTVQPTPVITSQPTNITTCDFQNISFSTAATGAVLSYQWQVNTGLGFVNLPSTSPYSGALSPTLGIANVSNTFTGYQYRCEITGTCTPSVITNVVNLTVNSRPVITGSPATSTVCAGGATSFTMSATGTGIGYQWQVDNGSGYTNVLNSGIYSGATTSTLSLTGVPATLHGVGYRCLVTGSCSPPVSTSAAILYVNSAPTVFSHPTDKPVCVGSSVSFSAAGTIATATASPTYQWEVNTGSGFTTLTNVAPYSGVTTANLIISNATTALNGYTYRCVISNGSCTPNAITNAAVLTVNTLPTITSQPVNKTQCPGSNTSFTVAATGTALTYQWQENNGSGYVNIPGSAPYTGSNTATLAINNVTLAMHNYLYRCIVRGDCSPAATSAAARLQILNPVTINSQTLTDTVCEGGVTKLGVRATGAGVMYQWQIKQTDGTYLNLTNVPPYSAVNTDSLRISIAPNTLQGAIFRCAITENQLCGLWYYTADIPLGINPVPPSNPAKLIIAPLHVAVFSVPTGGTTYQWQEDNNNGNGFRNLSEGIPYKGVYTNTLSVDPIQLTMSGNMYRCVIDGICVAAVTSKSSELIINPALTVGNTVTQDNGVSVYPNPLSGAKLNVAFKSPIAGTTEVKVMDKLGKVVYTGLLELNSNNVATVNLQGLAAGIYMLHVVNANENVNVTIQFTKQ